MPSTNQPGINYEAWAKDIEEQGYAECVVCDKKTHGDTFEDIFTKFAEHVVEEHDPENNAPPIPWLLPL